MTWTTEVFGKCILSGEHAVLRGVPALVVPVKSRSLKLEYIPDDSDFRVESADIASEPTKVVMWGVIEKALSQLGKNYSDIKGTLRVKNTVPFGAGLGASAALCVAVARFFNSLGWLEKSAIFEFARTLENIFHGESSGVDVAVTEFGRPIRFQRGAGFEELKINWRPHFYLSYSGHKGVTSECVSQVKKLGEKNEAFGKQLDQKMKTSVEQLLKVMTDSNLPENDKHAEVIRSLDLARECFEQWGPTKGNLEQHMKFLMNSGAKACKPTGSGGGGHVLSYWLTPPPAELGLIPLHLDS